jgi:ankyrin repeat protein
VDSGHETSKDAGLANIMSSVPEISLSFNSQHNSPLHLAASHSHSEVVRFLSSTFPHCVNRPNERGATPLMLASESVRPPSSSNALVSSKVAPFRNAGNEVANTDTLQTLLENGADPNATDLLGNTALHYASAWGNLKALRILVAAGAEPMAKNIYSWTPVSYSCTVQAEVYFKNFVLEFEKRKYGGAVTGTGTGNGKGGGGVRLVTDGDVEDEVGEVDEGEE